MRHSLGGPTAIMWDISFHVSFFVMKLRILLSRSSMFWSRLTILSRSSPLFLADNSKRIKIFLLPSSSLVILWSMLSCCLSFILPVIYPPANETSYQRTSYYSQICTGGICHVDTLVTAFWNASPYTENLRPHDTMMFSTNYNIFFLFY